MKRNLLPHGSEGWEVPNQEVGIWQGLLAVASGEEQQRHAERENKR